MSKSGLFYTFVDNNTIYLYLLSCFHIPIKNNVDTSYKHTDLHLTSRYDGFHFNTIHRRSCSVKFNFRWKITNAVW